MIGVQPHLLALIAGQRARLGPHADRHRDPADVVHQRRPPQPGRLRRGQPGDRGSASRPGRRHRGSAQPSTCSSGRRSPPSPTGRRPSGPRPHRPRPGLGGQCLLPDGRRIQARVSGSPRARKAATARGSRPEPARRPATCAGQRWATLLPGHVRVLRHLHEPHRQRDLLARAGPRHAPCRPSAPTDAAARPEPARVRPIRAPSSSRTSQWLAAHLRNSATPPNADLAIAAARASRGRPGGPPAPPSPPDPAGSRERRHHLRPRRQFVPEEPRVDLTLGRAPGEVQQPGVEDGRLIVLGQAQRLRDPHPEHRRAQPVLQRLAHRQVSGQRQGRPTPRPAAAAQNPASRPPATKTHPDSGRPCRNPPRPTS